MTPVEQIDSLFILHLRTVSTTLFFVTPGHREACRDAGEEQETDMGQISL